MKRESAFTAAFIRDASFTRLGKCSKKPKTSWSDVSSSSMPAFEGQCRRLATHAAAGGAYAKLAWDAKRIAKNRLKLNRALARSEGFWA
jgi:hypothetical protein